METAAFKKKKALSTSKLDLNLRKKLTMNIWSMALYGVESWTHRKTDENYFITICFRQHN